MLRVADTSRPSSQRTIISGFEGTAASAISQGRPEFSNFEGLLPKYPEGLQIACQENWEPRVSSHGDQRQGPLSPEASRVSGRSKPRFAILTDSDNHLPFVPFRVFDPFHSIPFHSIPFHSIPFHSIPSFHSIIHFPSIPFALLSPWTDQ